jgi:hypothetical protein
MLVRKHKNIHNCYFSSTEITVYSSCLHVLPILSSQPVDMLMVSGNEVVHQRQRNTCINDSHDI